MDKYQPYLEWIDARHEDMLERVLKWSAINSGSTNVAGLGIMIEALRQAFEPLGGAIEDIPLNPREVVLCDGTVGQEPLGHALRVTKRAQARHKILLAIHMDTVFAADHPFQDCRFIDNNTLNGPGVADAKGGIAVILTALEALERSPFAGEIGFQVLINPDEEIGSPGSAGLLEEAARWAHLGLLYEPALADGTLAGARKGSGNYAAVVRGRSAHAGREHAKGRNAIAALAEFIGAIDGLNGQREGVTVTAAVIEGGAALNVVPDLAICRFNIRIGVPGDQDWIEGCLDAISGRIARRDGIAIELHGGFGRPPKILSDHDKRLLDLIAGCGSELGLAIKAKATGGCCDGNNLAALGLANVDTLGARGGAIHSADEFLLLDSLTERAKLTALFLMKLGAGEIEWSTAAPRG